MMDTDWRARTTTFQAVAPIPNGMSVSENDAEMIELSSLNAGSPSPVGSCEAELVHPLDQAAAEDRRGTMARLLRLLS